MKAYVERFKNPGTILSIISLVGLILIQFGMDIDMVWLETTAKLFCTLGVMIGVLNNPTTSGVDLPTMKNDEEVN